MDHPEGHNGPQEGSSKGGKWTRNLLGLNKQSKLMDKISHLEPGKVEKASDIKERHRKYQTIREELDILTQDYRIEQFNNKSQAETRNDYTTRIHAFDPANEAGQQELAGLEEWGKQMKAHIGNVISKREESWKEASRQTSSDFQTSQQNINSQYGHLIDSEQRKNLDTIIEN